MAPAAFLIPYPGGDSLRTPGKVGPWEGEWLTLALPHLLGHVKAAWP